MDKKFVTTLSSLIDKETLNLNHDNLVAENSDSNLEKFVKNPTRWSVKRLRRKLKIKNEKNTTSEDELSDDSFKDVPSEFNEIIVIGNNLSEPLNESNLSICSDQDSTTGEESSLDDEDLSELNSDLLLYKAAASHNLPVMCQALALGANKNWSNEKDNGRKPLHQAIISGSVMACEYLLLNGVQIDAVDLNGYTSLHLATERGSTAQAYLLLKHRARHDIKAVDGKLPIDIAVEQANADIVTL